MVASIQIGEAAIMKSDHTFLSIEPLIPTAGGIYSPLVSRERWAQMLGLPFGVVNAQCERGLYGPPVRIGKRTLVNVEALRVACAQRAQEFVL